MPTEQLNGIELHYEEYGAGPPVVFLHGAGGGTQIGWFQQIPHFERDYRCIVIDHRGFGTSTDPDQEGPTRFVDDLEALLDRLGIERAALIAQSMGGWTALGLAVRHPSRVSALVMCDCVGDLDWPELHSVMEALDEQTRDIPGLDRAYAEDNVARWLLSGVEQTPTINVPIFVDADGAVTIGGLDAAAMEALGAAQSIPVEQVATITGMGISQLRVRTLADGLSLSVNGNDLPLLSTSSGELFNVLALLQSMPGMEGMAESLQLAALWAQVVNEVDAVITITFS